MKQNYFKQKIILPILLAFFFPTLLFAVDFTSSVPLDIVLSNNSPKPFERVTARAQSFRFDLNRSAISWSVNGRAFRSGVGVTEIELTAGESGSVTTIGIIVETPDGSISQATRVRPAGVDILWQADTYTPSFYRGKARASSAARLRIVAMPDIVGANGRAVLPKELVYRWNVNGSVLSEQSGFGRNAIDIIGARIYGDTEILVDVSTRDGDIAAKNYIVIPAEDPELVFYENAPLEGVRYEHALLESVRLDNQEIEIRAEPYFVSDTGELDHEWTLNGRAFSTTGGEWNEVVFRRPEGIQGRSLVELFIRGLSGIRGRVLQSANTSLSIEFDEGGLLNNLFGL